MSEEELPSILSIDNQEEELSALELARLNEEAKNLSPEAINNQRELDYYMKSGIELDLGSKRELNSLLELSMDKDIKVNSPDDMQYTAPEFKPYEPKPMSRKPNPLTFEGYQEMKEGGLLDMTHSEEWLEEHKDTQGLTSESGTYTDDEGTEINYEYIQDKSGGLAYTEAYDTYSKEDKKIIEDTKQSIRVIDQLTQRKDWPDTLEELRGFWGEDLTEEEIKAKFIKEMWPNANMDLYNEFQNKVQLFDEKNK